MFYCKHWDLQQIIWMSHYWSVSALTISVLSGDHLLYCHQTIVGATTANNLNHSACGAMCTYLLQTHCSFPFFSNLQLTINNVGNIIHISIHRISWSTFLVHALLKLNSGPKKNSFYWAEINISCDWFPEGKY